MVCVTTIEAPPSKMVYNEHRNVDEKCDDVAKILAEKENANINKGEGCSYVEGSCVP
jgi:hypothetical protein